MSTPHPAESSAQQPADLRIPRQLVDEAHEQPVRDGAWALIVAGEEDDHVLAAQIMELADGTVDPEEAESIAAFLRDVHRSGRAQR